MMPRDEVRHNHAFLTCCRGQLFFVGTAEVSGRLSGQAVDVNRPGLTFFSLEGVFRWLILMETRHGGHHSVVGFAD